MARIRYIKPEFFFSEQVGRLSMTARVLFIGLWTVADREGRLSWSPGRIKAQLFPYDSDIVMHALAEELVNNGLLAIYDTPGGVCAWVPGFTKHQRPHPKEAASDLPACPPGHPKDLLPWKNTASREKPGSFPSSRGEWGGKGMENGEEEVPPIAPHGGSAQAAEDSPHQKRFDRWYASYPLKVGRGAAWRAWSKLKPMPNDALVEQMIAAVVKQQGCDRWQRGFVPNPATWISQQRWLDDVSSVAQREADELAKFRPEGA